MRIALTSLCFVMAILLVSFIPLASAQESGSCSALAKNDSISNTSNSSCDDGFSINVGLAKMTGGTVVRAPQKAGLIESVFISIARFFRNIFR